MKTRCKEVIQELKKIICKEHLKNKKDWNVNKNLMKEGKLETNIVEHNFMKYKFAEFCFDVNRCWHQGKIYPES